MNPRHNQRVNKAVTFEVLSIQNNTTKTSIETFINFTKGYHLLKAVFYLTSFHGWNNLYEEIRWMGISLNFLQSVPDSLTLLWLTLDDLTRQGETSQAGKH